MSSSLFRRSLAALSVTILLAGPALDQPQPSGPGPQTSVTIAGITSGEADLGDTDTIQWSRSALGASAQWTTPSRLGYGVSTLFGRTTYRFDTAFLGDTDVDINEFTLSVPLSFPVGSTGRVFLSPNLAYHGEDGVDFATGTSYGLIAGIGWRASPSLFIGPGLGVSSSLRDDTDPTVFPFVVVDWSITDTVSLSTGAGFGATRGPGLRLAYAPSTDWTFGLEARLEEFEFALNDDGDIPDGVGNERHIPVLLTARYAPSDMLTLSGFAGAAFGGRLRVYDEAGDEVYDEDFETTPLIGLAATFRF